MHDKKVQGGFLPARCKEELRGARAYLIRDAEYLLTARHGSGVVNTRRDDARSSESFEWRRTLRLEL